MVHAKAKELHDDSSSAESDEQREDHVEPYKYQELQAPRATRLILLQPGSRKDEIVCKIMEVDLDPQYTKDSRRVEAILKQRKKSQQTQKDRDSGASKSDSKHAGTANVHQHQTRHPSVQLLKTFEDYEPIVPGLGEGPGIPKSYEALSWSWGAASWDSQIKIDKDGVRFFFNVPQTLIEAFRALRKKKTERVLWVDAISIDQKNDDEKSQQVPMMSEIYGGAKSVCVWLGEGDADSKIAFEFIQNEVIKLEDFDKLCEGLEAAPKWNAMFSLMKRPWFSRRWIVQEIALAKEARLYCGKKNIPWQDFADAVQLFVSVESATHRLSEVMKIHDSFYHVPRWFEYVSKLGASLLVDATGTLFRYAKNEWPEFEVTPSGHRRPKKMNLDIPGAPKRLSERSNRQALLSLEHLVSTLTIFQATNPRDIIYALLAIAKDTNPVPGGKGKPAYLSDALKSITVGMKLQARPYVVDYTKSYVDICADFVQFAINQQADRTRALDIICRPWAPESKRTERRTQHDAPTPLSPSGGVSNDGDEAEVMPSWIPQLYRASHNMIRHADSVEKMGRINADPLVGLPELTQRNYNAAGDKSVDLTRVKIKRRKKYHSIDVLGFVLDRVDSVDKQSQNGNIPLSWFQMGQVDVKSFGRTDHDQQTKDYWDEFWRTLVADRGQSGRNPPAYYARAFEMSLKKGLLATGSLNTTDMIDHGRCSVVSEFFRRVQSVIWNRCLVRTEKGRLGMVNEGVEKGDLICILDGCSVPVILRPTEKVKSEIEDDLKAEDQELEEWSRVAQRRHRIRNQPRKPLRKIVEEERAKLDAKKKGQSTPKIGPPTGPSADQSQNHVATSPDTDVNAQQDPPSAEGSAGRTPLENEPSDSRPRSRAGKKGRKGTSSQFNDLKRQDSQATLAGSHILDRDEDTRGLGTTRLHKERIRVWKQYFCQLMGEAFIYGVMDGEAIALYNRDMAQRGGTKDDDERSESTSNGEKDPYAGMRLVNTVNDVKVYVSRDKVEDQFPLFRNQVFELR
ncbi:hypothetical protein N0V90_003087 [Kalmusia sp. IMI 367209]|nr:hypothetical protein N0V90_003087 [Kalmusia sp. IMI 367209]